MRLQIIVPLPTYPECNSEKLAAHIAAAAEHLSANVHALILAPDFPIKPNLVANLLIDLSRAIADAKTQSRVRGAALVAALNEELRSADISFGSAEIACPPVLFGDTAACNARYRDLAIVGLSDNKFILVDTAERVVFGAGRPVLLVPECAPPSTFRRILIAWDGSRVAARAVADARDFLSRAETITIVSVFDEKSMPDEDIGKRLADHLAAHGKAAEVGLIRGGSHPIAHTLQEHAKAIGADLLVMGAFGHSRVRDFVLGGATAGILKNLRLPSLLSH